MRLRDQLPAIYQPWLTTPEWDRSLIERRATCENCIQAKGVTAIYKESLKCCTFFPFLPNYAVGQILSSNLPGRQWLKSLCQTERLDDGTQTGIEGDGRVSQAESVVLPLGVLPSIHYQRRWKKLQPDGYGNDDSLICPHFIKGSGRCAIWTMCPSPCISFYCESSHGIRGIEFWARFEKWLSFVELNLAREALLRQGFTTPEAEASMRFLPRYGEPDRHAPTGRKLKETEAKAWCEFGADRIEFYLRSYEIVRGLSETEVRGLMGEEGTRMEAEVLALAANLIQHA